MVWLVVLLIARTRVNLHRGGRPDRVGKANFDREVRSRFKLHFLEGVENKHTPSYWGGEMAKQLAGWDYCMKLDG